MESDDAHWLLDFYKTFDVADSDDKPHLLGSALSCLSQIKGSFSFVVYDANQHRVLAGRDADGTQPFFWGVTDFGQLMFSSSLVDLEGCNPTSVQFPAGAWCVCGGIWFVFKRNLFLGF